MGKGDQFGDGFFPVYVGGSEALRAGMAPSTPAVDRLKRLLNSADESNIRSTFAEAALIADRENPDQLALLVQLAKLFAQAYPGEPLPLELD